MHPRQAEEVERLREQSRRIGTGELLPEVVALVRQRVPEPGTQMFLFEHIPEQGEDIYIFVTSSRLVISIEVPRRGTDDAAIEVKPLEAFRRASHAKGANRTLEAIRVILSGRSGDA